MKYGFLRTAAVSPALHVADCAYNTQQIIAAMRAQAVAGTKLLCLPEFTLTGYTCSDLFLQETLCRGAEDGLIQILDASKELDVVALVGLPVRHNGKLYNCAAVVCKGQLLGLVPKTYLPNYGEFYERRHFVPGPKDAFEITFAGQRTLFGTNLLFACREMPEFVLGVEICEDLWAPVPPSCSHALAGATVVANLSASDETVGKAAYRRELVAGQSARLLCGYVYADAGHGESTTDMTFAGHNLIATAGKNADVSVVKNLFIGVGSALSVFVRKLGIRLIANQGPLQMQAQNDVMALLARKEISIVSTEDSIEIIAKKRVTINGGGSYITLNASGIESATAGEYRTRAGYYVRREKAQHKPDIAPLANAINDDSHNIRYLCTDDNGMPMMNTPYRAFLADGSVLEGVSDGEGYTKLFTSAQIQDVLLHMIPEAINA